MSGTAAVVGGAWSWGVLFIDSNRREGKGKGRLRAQIHVYNLKNFEIPIYFDWQFLAIVM